jgi:hypothetical protein
MIVERDSSTSGYPGEITKPLDADHHDVCKYMNKDDSNYKSIRDVLSSIVERFRNKGKGLLFDFAMRFQLEDRYPFFDP